MRAKKEIRLKSNQEDTKVSPSPLAKLDPIYKKDIQKRRQLLKSLLGRAEQGKEHTIIVVSSLSFDSEDLKDIKGVVHYESRGLWEVLKASTEKTNIVFVSSLPISEESLTHLLEHMPNSEEVRKRITLLSLNDSSSKRSLSQKILSNDEFISKLKECYDPKNSYLQTFISSEDEYQLAEVLGIPLFGADPKLAYFQTKSGNRQVFSEANVRHADGYSDIKSVTQLKQCLLKLWSRHPKAKRFMLKLDMGVSGKGNAVINLPSSYREFCQIDSKEHDTFFEKTFDNCEFQASNTTWKEFSSRLVKGAVLETFIEGDIKSSPSAQVLIHPCGKVEILSTHEQILDNSGMSFLGSVFPAKLDYRHQLQNSAIEIAESLSHHGVLGTIAIDYLLVHDNEVPEVWVIEINVRRGGTTHPYQTAKLITDSQYDLGKGILVDRKGREVHYISDDNIIDDKLRGHLAKDFLSFMQGQGVIYNADNSCGVIFHLLEAIEEHGKLGYTAIGTSSSEAEAVYNQALTQIDKFIQLSSRS